MNIYQATILWTFVMYNKNDLLHILSIRLIFNFEQKCRISRVNNWEMKTIHCWKKFFDRKPEKIFY